MRTESTPAFLFKGYADYSVAYQNQPRELARSVSRNMIVSCYGICDILRETRRGDFDLISVSLGIGTVFLQIFSFVKTVISIKILKVVEIFKDLW